ncbi:ufm1-specific protease 2-like [Adelges cooleyi]|uniref:ufm1-specific protease 2-like n=1 Tax=Adelges cooleyi TaxID=133065 RepID=UPI0021804C95|nr:ufm1-specific protease 2-like [Adelges cooleyi]XP_050429657.1 ufm1-specific protease 2-like [Adelges cooleyi]
MKDNDPEVIICREVLENLKKNVTQKLNEFYLLAVDDNEGIAPKSYVIGFVDSSIDVENNYPYNIIIKGASGKAEHIEDVQESFANDENFRNVGKLLYLDFKDLELQLWRLVKNGDTQPEKIKYEVQSKKELCKQLIYFRVCMKFEVDQNIENCDSSYILNLVDKKIGVKPLFYLKEAKKFISNTDEKNMIGDIKSENKSDYEIINISVYQNLSMTPTENKDISDFPIIHQSNETYDEKLVCCQLDALCVASKSTSFKRMYNLLYGSIVKNAEAIFSFFVTNSKDLPAVHHFGPEELCHFVTIVCSHNQIDSYSNLRKKLHNAFKLSLNRPLFRISNAYLFNVTSVANEDGLLTNVHEGLNPSGINNGQISIVQGKYTYYHYGHGGFNDHQWGCAYRSLQTLYSWFRWQGWTNKPVPSILDIQQTLVDMGDKPKQFVGSKDWIGSLEVSYVLDSHLGATCRIMSLRQGDTLNSVCLELAEHFDRHGTPVMIGGGVLAHTIIGVDINEECGEVKFLVLDPHYTGSDNIKNIQGKGVFWKEASFWKKDAFYNLCLPLKFNGI